MDVSKRNDFTKEFILKFFPKKEILDELIKDVNLKVKNLVAECGHKEHLDKLVNDESWLVRSKVAEHGHKEHLQQLANDKNLIIKRKAAKRLRKLK